LEIYPSKLNGKGVQMPSNPKVSSNRAPRTIAGAATLLLCTACADPKAVQSFAAMAPPEQTAQTLTTAYVTEPVWRENTKILTNDPPQPALSQLLAIRSDQAKGFESTDTAIREYMQALGSLAADGVVQSTTHVKDLTSGLSAWQKAKPELGITTSQITLVTEVVQTVADLAENGYRDTKLSEIIGKSQQPFQELIDIQIEIVRNGIIPSMEEVGQVINDKKSAINRQSPGVRYLLGRDFNHDNTSAKNQIATANAYIKSLTAIKEAHTKLYEGRNDVLSKSMFDQIKPLAQESYKTYQDLRSEIAGSSER
jgi:hypothetical protein